MNDDTPFMIQARDGQARQGQLKLAHGIVQTPAFMPVGTLGTVKAMLPENVAATGAKMILGNSYHLMLRPGAEHIAEFGGLHSFMAWKGPILTDSGGFQIMSLAALRRLDETGVTFRSHIDGQAHHLTPERAMTIQYLLNSDISMVLDECTALPAEQKVLDQAMARSMRWAERCRAAFIRRNGYGLFGIVQGGTNPDLRHRSADALIKIGFDGYAIGGLAVGEGQTAMLATLDVTIPALPSDKPCYLMGVGTPSDLVEAVLRGVDLLDCVLPTRSGRNARAYTKGGALNLRNARHRSDPRPLETDCPCPACQNHSRAYLHHLVRANEILGAILLTWHNIQYYQNLMAGMRTAIQAGTLSRFVVRFYQQAALGDIAPL